MSSVQEERAKRLHKMATKAFVLNSFNRGDNDTDSNRSNESFDPATQVPRVQLEEELAVERKQVSELHSQMTCLGEELEQHKQQKQALEETVNNTQASLKNAENSLAAEKKQREKDRVNFETDKRKALEEKDTMFEQQKQNELEQSKNNLRDSELIPILCGGKQILVPKEKLMGENSPRSFLSKMIDGSKDFEIENGFLKLDLDPEIFESLVDYLANKDLFEMPETPEELQKLADAARKLGVTDLLDECKKQEILLSVPATEVFTFSSIDGAEKLIKTSSKMVVNLSIHFDKHDPSITSTKITEHYNVFFNLGRLLRHKFTFIFAPELLEGVFWNFYHNGDKIYSLAFHDRSQENRDSSQQLIFTPLQGARKTHCTETITEVFISSFSQMKLKDNERKRYFDLKWWRCVLNNENPDNDSDND